MEFWLDNPTILFKPEIMPSVKMTHIEKLNSIARFSLVFLVLLYVFNGDMRWMALSVSLLVLTVIFKQNKESLSQSNCYPKTEENPYGNFTVGDYINNPLRPEVCDKDNLDKSEELAEQGIPLIPDYYDRNIALRNFYTQPVTTIVNNQNDFAKFLLGKSSGDCKINGSNCYQNEDPRFHRGRYFNGNM